MTTRAALVLVGLAAALALPTAAAMAAPDATSTVMGTVAQTTTDLAAPALPTVRPTVDGLVGAAVSAAPVVPLPLDASARGGLEVAPDPDASPLQGTPPSASRPPSLSEQVAAVAVPAAGATLAAAVVAALAFGIDAVRATQARISSQLARVGRALIGLVAAVPLFSRIEGGSLMENRVRARVHEAVVQVPGLSLSDVQARTGIAWGTAVHHLRRLERHGLVVSVNQLAHRRFFAANSPAAHQRTAVAVVAHPTARRIAHLVNQRPGIGQTGICQTLGLKNPAASKHLRHFEVEGLVRSQRSGRQRIYTPTPALDSALLILEPAGPAIAMVGRRSTALAAPGAW